MKVELTDEELKMIVESLYHFYWGCDLYDWMTLSDEEMDRLKPKAWELRKRLKSIGKISVNY